MDEKQKRDEELAWAQRETLKQAPPEEADAADGQPARRVLGPEATKVLREFYEEAKAKGPQLSMRDRMALHLQHPYTHQTSDN
jgi:hypothetical protein